MTRRARAGEVTIAGMGPVEEARGAALGKTDGQADGKEAKARDRVAGAGEGRQAGKVGQARADGKACYPSGRHGGGPARGNRVG